MSKPHRKRAAETRSGKRSRSSAPGAADDLACELVRIRSLNTDELRSSWIKVTGSSPTRQVCGDLLRRMVMHRVQEQRLGGLDRPTARMLDRLADGGVAPILLKLGSVIVREHDGAMHQVMVVKGGFAWNGQIYSSLSAVAKAITGTIWNGNRFFGLRRPVVTNREPPALETSCSGATTASSPETIGEASA